MAALTWRLPPQATVFVDTSAMFGLTVVSDQRNSDAVILSRQLKEVRARLVTSNFVVAEYHALLVNRVSSHFANIALSAVDRGETRIVLISPADEARAREILARYDDHGYTLTDATSFAVMERLGIRMAFTFDHHFAMQGFTIPS